MNQNAEGKGRIYKIRRKRKGKKGRSVTGTIIVK
jgi:hypothetical protein